MTNSIIDDTTAIAKRLREITGETTKAKVVKHNQGLFAFEGAACK